MSEPWPDEGIDKNDGRIGKEIDWSLVIPSITRPVWEPPMLEVLDMFEGDGETGVFDLKNGDLAAEIPDLDIRLNLADYACEIVPMREYIEWAKETLIAAENAEDQQKADFYEDLIRALRFEAKEVQEEWEQYASDRNESFRRDSCTSECSGTEDGDVGADDELCRFQARINTFAATTNNEESAHSSAEIGSITSLLPYHLTDHVEAATSATNTSPRPLGVFRALACRLCCYCAEPEND